MMLECWELEPDARGSFEQKRARLATMAATLAADPITRSMFKGRSPKPATSTGAATSGGDGGDDDEDESAGAGTEPTYRPVYAAPTGGSGGGADGGGGAVAAARAAYEQIGAAGGGSAYEVPAGVGAYGMQQASRGGRRTFRRKKSVASPEVKVGAVAKWISDKTGAKVDAADLHGSLRSGVLLCKLANALAPKAVKGTVYKGKGVFKQRENISKAIDAFHTTFNIPNSALFDVADLFEDVDMVRVVQCLATLMKQFGA
jgi:hypothetical protein